MQVELVAGPPAKIVIPGWDVTRVTSLLASHIKINNTLLFMLQCVVRTAFLAVPFCEFLSSIPPFRNNIANSLTVLNRDVSRSLA